MKNKMISMVLAGLLSFIIGVPVFAAEIDTDIYETLRTPNYEELKIEIEDTDINYTMDVCDNRVYIVGDALTVEHEKKEVPVVLVYDETDNTWSSIWATFLNSGGELDIIAGDDVLYFFDNHYSSLTIHGYDLKTKVVKQLSSFNWETEKRAPELSYDGEYIWMYGGEYRDAQTGEWTMLSGVSRWNISTGNLEEVEVSEEEKALLFENIAKQREEEIQILTEAKEALKVSDEEELACVLTDEKFYVFGDIMTGEEREQIFCCFSEKTEAESVVEEQTEDIVVEEMIEVAEVQNDSEEGIMKLIVAICAVVAVVSVVVPVRHRMIKKKDMEKGEEE